MSIRSSMIMVQFGQLCVDLDPPCLHCAESWTRSAGAMASVPLILALALIEERCEVKPNLILDVAVIPRITVPISTPASMRARVL